MPFVIIGVVVLARADSNSGNNCSGHIRYGHLGDKRVV